ncbi:putative bifunctional diguanylate cyclase/phosphodiesterase [Alteromonas sp. 14N.309.X.WAT.G.H12]|uniref:putative bifunctional diguanylate cyclase/phosphodiesterase n=1 Tax=Alteromonas sp. 14N.309.X.WAT.G.H12 TaxID=3120824 RepID=UPI002FD12163
MVTGISDVTKLIESTAKQDLADIFLSLVNCTGSDNAAILLAPVDTSINPRCLLQLRLDDTLLNTVPFASVNNGNTLVSEPFAAARFTHRLQLLTTPDYTLYLSLFNTSPQLTGRDEIALQLSAERVQVLLQKAGMESEKIQYIEESHDALLNEFADISGVGGWEFDNGRQRLYFSTTLCRLLGISSVHPLSLREVLKPIPVVFRHKLIRAIQGLVHQQKAFCLEIPVYLTNKERLLRVSGKAGMLIQGATKFYGVVQDLTASMPLSQVDDNFSQNFGTILDSLNDVVLMVDGAGTIIAANVAISQHFGYAVSEILGECITCLFAKANEQDGQRMLYQLIKEESECNNLELTAMDRLGKPLPVEVSVTKLKHSDKAQFVCVLKNNAERKQTLDNIYQIAFFDEITQLPNLKSFEKDLRALIIAARPSDKHLYCCMLDIDNFAQFNLSFGKGTGDYILRIFAGRLKKVLSAQFQIYSGSGDKFYILYRLPFDERMDKHILAYIDEVAWSMHTELSKAFTLHGHSQIVTSSMASAFVHAQHASYEKVVGILEFGSRRAKSQGLGGKVTLDKEEFAAYERDNYIRQNFSRALDDGEFYVVLQPQYDAGGAVCGSEVLLRWNEKRLGQLSPVEFIPIAEGSDEIIEIGYWVLNEACRILSELSKQDIRTVLSVNVSGRQIVRPDFSDHLLELVHKWQVSPNQLTLEITESILVESIELVQNRMAQLAQLGFGFSIDDFGTGYSSLSYLKALPITELKIDRYFVDEINFDDDEVPIVNMIIDLARSMGVKTVAEGIENKIQLQYLTNKHCDLFQGFYLSTPMTEDAWRRCLTRANEKLTTV